MLLFILLFTVLSSLSIRRDGNVGEFIIYNTCNSSSFEMSSHCLHAERCTDSYAEALPVVCTLHTMYVVSLFAIRLYDGYFSIVLNSIESTMLTINSHSYPYPYPLVWTWFPLLNHFSRPAVSSFSCKCAENVGPNGTCARDKTAKSSSNKEKNKIIMPIWKATKRIRSKCAIKHAYAMYAMEFHRKSGWHCFHYTYQQAATCWVANSI